MKRTPQPRSESGAVLILCLLMITVLVVAVMETVQSMRVDYGSLAAFSGGSRARSLALSGVHFAAALVDADTREDLEQDLPSDHPGEAWGDPAGQDLVPMPELSTGEIRGRIADASARFPLHLLVDDTGRVRPTYRDAFVRLLQGPALGLEEEEAEDLADAVTDWLDPDQAAAGEGEGEEGGGYQGLALPYEPADGPFQFLGELRLIRGITRDLFQGRAGMPGLADLVRVQGPGAVNINTAEEDVLQALVQGDWDRDARLEVARAMISYRREPMHFDFLGEPDWYRNRMPGYADVQIAPEMTAVRSTVFTAEMVGVSGSMVSRVVARLVRVPKPDEENAMSVTVTRIEIE